ncbi:MAG: diguanylate cyclase [Vicinamibacteria bacterium]
MRTLVAVLTFTASVAFADLPIDLRPPRSLDLLDLTAPTFTTFTSREGVPDRFITGVQTDADGFVWLTSSAGLSRYDGNRFEQVAPQVKGQLRGMMVDQKKDLWVASSDRGLAHFNGKTWTTDGIATGMPTDRFTRVQEVRGANAGVDLWALSWDAGLFLRRGDTWEADPGNAQLPSGPLGALARTSTLGGRDRLWVATFNEGVWFRDLGGNWQPFKAKGFEPSQVSDFAVSTRDGREELWIATYGRGLWRLDPNGLTSWTIENGALPSNLLYNLEQSQLPNGDTVIWAASRGGLIRIYRDHAEVFDRRHGLLSDSIRAIHRWRSPDGVEVLWIAMENGVARTLVSSNPWQTASLMGSRGNGTFGVLIEPDNRGGERLWIGATVDGLGLYEAGRWRMFSAANRALPNSNVRLIKWARDDRGRSVRLAGLGDGTLMRVTEGPKFAEIKTPWPKTSGQAVLDVLGRSNNGRDEMWVATRESGIYRQTAGQWTAYRPASVVGQWRVVKLQDQRDSQGRPWLWATTNQGLARLDGDEWTLLGREAGLPDVDLIGADLYPDQEGRPILWVGSNHKGIIRLDVSDPMKPHVLPESDLPAPPDPTAYSATRDSKGRIFICTNDGAQLLTPDATGRYRERVFRRRDGLVNDECNTNAQVIDSHDRYWMGTLGGLIVYDPANEVTGTPLAKPLRLTHVRIDGEERPLNSVVMPSGARQIRIAYGLLSWNRESESRFRTELVGFDLAPSAWERPSSRTFTALPPGRYTLRIEGRDWAGLESQPIVLSIEVLAAWWQRRFVQVLLVLLFIALTFFAAQWRVRSLRRAKQKLEDLVAERTAELSAANLRLYDLSYIDQLTGLANRRRMQEALAELIPPEGQPPRQVSMIFIDVDLFKAYNDQHGHPAGDEALRVVGTILREQADFPGAVASRYGGEEFACLLSDVGIEDAFAVAETTRIRVSETDLPIPGESIQGRVTISAGVVSYLLSTTSEAHRLLRSADAALYQAKRDGRNRVQAGAMVNATSATPRPL